MTTELASSPPTSVPAPLPPARRDASAPRSSHRVRSVLKHVVLIAVALVMLYPLIWLVLASLRPSSAIFRNPGFSFDGLSFDNYVSGWNQLGAPFALFLGNSLILVIGSIIGNLVSCSLAAYAFARLEFRGRRLLFGLMLVTIMLPIHVIIVPQYVIFSQLHLVNTVLPLLIPKFLATDAFFVFLMVQFIRGIPRDLDEAARIDGAGHARIFFQVILPLMVPALATTAIFTFINTWNDFFGQLIYLTKQENWTVQLALNSFLDSSSRSDYGGMFAMSVVSLLPLFLVFLLGQRWLLRGISTTGIK